MIPYQMQKRTEPKRRVWMERANCYRTKKPGFTAKGDQRQFVKHDYTDRVNEQGDIDHAKNYSLVCYANEEKGKSLLPANKTWLPSPPFPLKLHMILESVENGDSRLKNAISWLPHGRAFHIRNNDLFTNEVLHKYFKNCKISSFYRQVNLYGFVRLSAGLDTGAYYHENFLRGKAFLTKHILRTKVKGTKYRSANAPQDEPKFYSMTSATSTSEVVLIRPKVCLAQMSSQAQFVPNNESNFYSMTSASSTPEHAFTPPTPFPKQPLSNILVPLGKNDACVPNETFQTSLPIIEKPECIHYAQSPYTDTMLYAPQQSATALCSNNLHYLLPDLSPPMRVVTGGHNEVSPSNTSFGHQSSLSECLLPPTRYVSEVARIASMINVLLPSNAAKLSMMRAMLDESDVEHLHSLQHAQSSSVSHPNLHRF